MNMRARFMYWWQQRAGREQWLLASAAGMLLFVFVYLLFEPVLQRREQLHADIPRLHEDLVWMQTQLADLERRRGTADPSPSTRTPLTITLVEELLRNAGIHEQVSDLRPVQGQSVMVRFDQVVYTQVMEFLLQVHNRAAARVSLASIRRMQDQTGQVEVSLTLSPDVSR